MSQIEEFYNAVAYPAFAYPNTHPSRLATMAMLHGLQPAPVESCRVLEIGCNEGANLIPMAYALPGSRFVGFDLAGEPVARGVQSVRDLRLENIQLFQADLMEAEGLPELAGEFDYILVHGLYSWIPEPVRDRLLALCRSLLAENGVAFISYNTLPGGHIRNLVRDIFNTPRVRPAEADLIADAKESIEFLKFITNCRPEGDGFRVLLERELESLERRSPSVVVHDEMAPDFKPVSFTEFARHASRHQLQFLGEGEFPNAIDISYNRELGVKISAYAGGDPIAQEQIFDLVRMRMYRETLLCRAEAPITYDVQLQPLQQLEFQATSSSAEGRAAASRVYTSTNGVRIESQHPATIAVMEYLVGILPESATFAQIMNRLGIVGSDIGADLLVMLFQLVVSRMLSLHAWHPPVSRTVATRPLASEVCRRQAVSAAQATTLLHTAVDLKDPVVRNLVQLLDGTRDRDELLRDLARLVPETPHQELQDGIDAALRFLAQTGTLEVRPAVLNAVQQGSSVIG